MGALVALGCVWLVGKALGLSFVKRSAPVPFEAYPEPERSSLPEDGARPRNVILFVADGLGFSHLALAQHTVGKEPVWHRFEVRAWHDPRPVRGPITDSAASATAMATGQLTLNDKVGVDENDRPVQTVFEMAWERGYRTGIVTDSYIWDATPAAFVTHTASRDNAEDILRQEASGQLDVLLGELEDVGEGEVPSWDATVEILEGRFTLLGADLALPEGAGADQPVASIHPEESITDLESTPSLSSMVTFATERLEDTGEPFLLLIETEELDSASHERDAPRAVEGLATLSSVLEQVLAFSRARGDTLVLFTADHETGGLSLGYDLGSYPDIVPTWGTPDHTSTVVPLLADGPGAVLFADVQRVWQVGEVLKALIGGPDPLPEAR